MKTDEPRGGEPGAPSALERALRALILVMRGQHVGGPPLDAPLGEAR
jgi:hypothetical protein